MLEVKQLSVSFGAVRALDAVSLVVPRGEVTAVIGANGAGKSTLMRTLAGLVKPESGSAELDGVQVTGRSPEDIVRSGMALIPEGRSTIPELTVEDNLHLGGLWRPSAERKATSAEIYDMFPVLAERRRMRSDTLSGGERQQLAIGRALMSKPKLLLLDEPSLGLAPIIIQQIFDIIEQLRNEGVTVFLVEQNANQALKIADRAYVLENGRVVMQGTGEQLLNDPKVRDAYLGG